MSKTLENMLNKIRLQKTAAADKARAELLKRNGLTERDLLERDGKGPLWRLEAVDDSRNNADDMVSLRLYKLHDATTFYLQGMVRTVTEDGIENLPEIKNYPKEINL